MTDTNLDLGEVGEAIGAIALIGAILGVAAYVIQGIVGNPTSSAAVWRYVLGGAAGLLLYAAAEWVLNSLGTVVSWHTAEHPPMKRAIAYAVMVAVSGLILFFIYVVGWT
jgi:hypothetical protein